MNKNEIKEKVLEVISAALVGRVEVSEIEDCNNIVDAFNVNSIEGIEIIVRLENEFDIEVDDDDLSVEFISSIDKIADYIMTKMN
jgi:acyl carrier protein